ncbi:hypothetical protein Vadar_013287 [Vaccinium darrowii]|uniref:Uncharacterized protein n=1 Tax=Vaccinium darrowii TaxID=229202 RepID=A0ACB7XQE0_9ERIC|nr:hypothetical protein Vadar_013287 [Vaccinium darrowii]
MDVRRGRRRQVEVVGDTDRQEEQWPAAKGRVEVLRELTEAMSGRIESTHDRLQVLQGGGGGGETVLHLCVKYNRLMALKLVVEWMRSVANGVGENDSVINSKDRDRNTIFHLAAALKQRESAPSTPPPAPSPLARCEVEGHSSIPVVEFADAAVCPQQLSDDVHVALGTCYVKERSPQCLNCLVVDGSYFRMLVISHFPEVLEAYCVGFGPPKLKHVDARPLWEDLRQNKIPLLLVVGEKMLSLKRQLGKCSKKPIMGQGA